MEGRIVITLNPSTNDVRVESNMGPADTVLTLARAHQLTLAHASKTHSPIQVPTAESGKALLNGHRH